ncbi:MAG: HD domain-containing protein [Campylobacterota bacterium]|nr:HD domain-containing protein [Campylobacterota bacterium]
MQLEIQIEDLIEKQASDFEISKLFKSYINEYLSSLDDIFVNNQGKDFLVKHTKSLDSIISIMYKTVTRKMFGNYLPMKSSIPIAIIALGSYGREQLCVHSDIDLMIVHQDIDAYNTSAIIEKLLYLAWDAGLKLGHRVHSVNDLFKSSRDDITIKSAFLESRFIAGSHFTWTEVEQQLNRIRHDNPKEFILAKIDESNIRRKKHPISMQPNLKESIGGLRDSQVLFWIAKTKYNIKTLKDLIGTLFSDQEYREYRVSLELLFRARSALHVLTSKQQDTLILEYIPQVAKMLGYDNYIRFAKDIIQSGWRINNFSQIFIKKVLRSYLYDNSNIKQLRNSRVQKGIYLCNDTLFASYNVEPFKINDLLSLLVSLEDRDINFDGSFLRVVTYASIYHPFKAKTYSFIKQIFSKKDSYQFFQLFYDCGILHEIFGAFKKVKYLPQFDGYHQYSVDIHSIKCVEALENIKDPYINELYNSLKDDEKIVLKIVTLYHDSGKGRKQDHSEIGAKLVAPFLREFKFKEDLIQRAETLVKHHILMSSIAFNENIYSEKTIYKFMSRVKTQKNLTLLYILTYADINGVGGSVYNSFNANLLRQLYDISKQASNDVQRISDASKRVKIEKRLQNGDDFLKLPRTLQKKILQIESNLFFFSHKLDEIIHVASLAKSVTTYNYSYKIENGFHISIIKRVDLNIGYLIGKLNFLNIVSMQIYTLFDGLKYFKLEFIEEPSRDILSNIEEIIDDSFDMSKKVVIKKPNIESKNIYLDYEHSKDYANFSVNTTNQNGLLAYILLVIDNYSVNIATAKIFTTKTRAKDTFLIEKNTNVRDNMQKVVKELVNQG